MFSLKIEADSPPLFLEKYYFNLKNSIKAVADSLAFLKGCLSKFFLNGQIYQYRAFYFFI